MMWNGDFPNDDLPYMVRAGGKPLVIIPYTKESDDREIYQMARTEVHIPSVPDILRYINSKIRTHRGGQYD
jgi:hypothetical protein